MEQNGPELAERLIVIHSPFAGCKNSKIISHLICAKWLKKKTHHNTIL